MALITLSPEAKAPQQPKPTSAPGLDLQKSQDKLIVDGELVLYGTVGASWWDGENAFCAKEVIEAKPIKHAFKSSTSILRIYLLSCVNYIFVVIAQNVMKIRLI